MASSNTKTIIPYIAFNFNSEYYIICVAEQNIVFDCSRLHGRIEYKYEGGERVSETEMLADGLMEQFELLRKRSNDEATNDEIARMAEAMANVSKAILTVWANWFD